jgi:hypothetical protein
VQYLFFYGLYPVATYQVSQQRILEAGCLASLAGVV